MSAAVLACVMTFLALCVIGVVAFIVFVPRPQEPWPSDSAMAPANDPRYRWADSKVVDAVLDPRRGKTN